MGHAPGCYSNAGAFCCLRDLVYQRKLYSQEKSLLKETFYSLWKLLCFNRQKKTHTRWVIWSLLR